MELLFLESSNKTKFEKISKEEFDQNMLEAVEEFNKVETECILQEAQLYIENVELFNEVDENGNPTDDETEADNALARGNPQQAAPKATKPIENTTEKVETAKQTQEKNESVFKKIVNLIVKMFSGLWKFIKKVLTTIGNLILTVLTKLKGFVEKLNKKVNQQQNNNQQPNNQQQNNNQQPNNQQQTQPAAQQDSNTNPSMQEGFSENFDFDIFNEFSGVGTPNMASEMSVTQNYAAYNPIGNASPTINSQPSYTPQPKEYDNPGGSAPKMETLQALDECAKFLEDPSDYNDFDNIITTVRKILIKPQEDDSQIININSKLKEIHNKMLQQINLNNSKTYQSFDKMSSEDDEIVNYDEYVKRATYYTNIYYRFNQNYPKAKAVADNIVKKISTFENDNVVLGKSLLQRIHYRENKNNFKKSISEFCSLMKKIIVLDQKVVNKFISILNKASHSFNTSDANGNFAPKKISKYNKNTR